MGGLDLESCRYGKEVPDDRTHMCILSCELAEVRLPCWQLTVEDIISLRNSFEVGYIFFSGRVKGIGGSDCLFSTDEKAKASREFTLWLAPCLADEAS